jgi:hypothetical protein
MQARPQGHSIPELLGQLLEAIERRRLVLFLGPGATIGASPLASVSGAAASTGIMQDSIAGVVSGDRVDEYLRHLLGHSPLASIPSGLISYAAEAYEASFGRSELVDLLRDEYSRRMPQWLHRLLWYLPLGAIYTTNYDLLVERAANDQLEGFSGNSRLTILPILDGEDTGRLGRDFGSSTVPYYKLFGCLKAGSPVITSQDYVAFFQRAFKPTPVFQDLRSCLCDPDQTRLFIGFEPADTHLLSAIFATCRDNSQQLASSLATVHLCNSSIAGYWESAFKIKVVSYDFEVLLADLLKLRGMPPSPWTQFVRILNETAYAGMSLYGKNLDDTLLRTMLEKCRQQKALHVTIDVSPASRLEPGHRERMLVLLDNIAGQMDVQLSGLEIPNPGLKDRITSNWNKLRAETDDLFRESAEWTEWSSDANKIRKYEDRLASRASELLVARLQSKLDSRRLIIFICGLSAIEGDDSLFEVVARHVLAKLAYEDNIGLVLVRHSVQPLSPRLGRHFTAESLRRTEEICVDEDHGI